MITRRQFGATGLVGALATTVRDVGSAQQRRRRNTLMHVGGDYHCVLGAEITSRQNLEFNLRHGMKHLTVEGKGSWDVKELKSAKDNCDKYGVVLEAVRMNSDYIKLPKRPERDREIATIATNVRNLAQIGVKILTYHWELIPFRRNAKMPGRGGVTSIATNWRTIGKACPREKPVA